MLPADASAAAGEGIKPKMKSAKNLPIALLAVSLLVAGNVVTHAQTAPPTNDQTKTGPSGTKQKGKKGAGSAATPKKDSSNNSTASTAAATPAAAAANPASAPGGSAPAPKTATAQQAPPANSAGMVWVNTDSGVYHKPGMRWYGKTKQGKYMTEADAQKAGYRASGAAAPKKKSN
jgi:cytoskeletal protein RodZ